LLVVEYIKSIVNILGAEHSVGIICPYRSQADLVKKLMAKQNFDNLMYQADTIHGFQGGQKDIVFCIFNTPLKYPPTSKTTQFIAGTQNAIMLNKRYIINVGVSRARKYLFLLIPDYYNKDTKANIPGYKNLTELNDLLEIIKNRIDPQFVLDIHSDIMEKHMFGTQSYILENSILIPHDKVNVYQRSPKHYLISHDENNIDVQLDYRTLDSRGELESVNAQSDKKVSQPAKLKS
jgi:mRNA-degrading endonuclease HigB of HigAB toxin-antitoxin module